MGMTLVRRVWKGISIRTIIKPGRHEMSVGVMVGLTYSHVDKISAGAVGELDSL